MLAPSKIYAVKTKAAPFPLLVHRGNCKYTIFFGAYLNLKAWNMSNPMA